MTGNYNECNTGLKWFKIIPICIRYVFGTNFLNIYMKGRFCSVILNRTPAFQWICIREGPKSPNLPNLWDLNKKYYKPLTRTPRTHRYSTLSPRIVELEIWKITHYNLIFMPAIELHFFLILQFGPEEHNYLGLKILNSSALRQKGKSQNGF